MSKYREKPFVKKVKDVALKNKKWIILVVITLVSFFVGFVARDFIPIAVVNDEIINRPAFTKALLNFGGKQALNTLITEKIILQEAKKKHLAVSKAEINNKLNELEKQLSTNNRSLADFLTLQSKTKSEFEEELRLQLLVEKRFRQDIRVSDQDIENYFVTAGIQKGFGAILESQKIAINRLLYQQKLREKLIEWLKEQRKNSQVKIFIRT